MLDKHIEFLRTIADDAMGMEPGDRQHVSEAIVAFEDAMIDWVPCSERLPKAGTAPYRSQPVLLQVAGMNGEFDETLDVWHAIRCTDGRGTIRWYGIENNGASPNLPTNYELIADDQAIAWAEWPSVSAERAND